MSTQYSLITCSACSGSGMQGATTCPTCTGTGSYIQGDNRILTYTVTAAQLTHTRTFWEYPFATPLTVGGFAVVCGASLIGLAVQDLAQLSTIFWRATPLSFTFGAAGLGLVWSLPHTQKATSSAQSLHALETSHETVIDLASYSNKRVAHLLQHAAQVAAALHTHTITDVILLITLLREPRIQGMLSRLELSSADLVQAAMQFVRVSEAGQTTQILPEVGTRILQGALQALENNFPYLDLEDILLAYLAAENQYADVFQHFGLTKQAFFAVAQWYAADQERQLQWAFWSDKGRTRSSGYMNRAWTALPTPYLDQFSTDLTLRAVHGGAVAASNRGDQIARSLEVLGRTQQNSLLLVGEPGVGKEALLGALAREMTVGRVPEILRDKRLLLLNLPSLLASPDQAAQRMQKGIEEAARAGNVILAIPDIHLLVSGTGAALDASAVVANALSRGDLQAIATAPYAAYHRFIESNPALMSSMTMVEVSEVTEDQAVAILEEEAPNLEGQHGVTFTYPAIVAAVSLSKRYIPDGILPGSAISLLDEAAASATQADQKWVRKADIESLVSRKTRTPIRTASHDEASALLNLEQTLHTRVVGQEEAVKAVASSIQRARAGLQDGKRPIATFLFVGPTGVGKTELAKALADTYFERDDAMVRLDMSEYQDATSVYHLIGAPAGQAGDRTEGGSLTQPIREHPFSLILLDELEKAHPDVLNLFLQLLDDGRLTENTGRTVNFTNCIVIATSNAASMDVAATQALAISPEERHHRVLGILQNYFRPEFINRFDQVVAFHPLTKDQVVVITQSLLDQLTRHMAEKNYTISYAPEVAPWLAEHGFDPEFGARPLRRIIQDRVEGVVARTILEGNLAPNGALHVTLEMIQ